MQKSFWQGAWILSGSLTPVYPLVLVCLAAIADSSLLSVARWLNLFIACFIYILAAILLWKIIQNRSVMFFAAIMMSFSIPFFANAISLGEEALFILLMLIFLHVLLKKEYSASVNFWLILLTIISCLTSQSGFCLIPTGGLFLMLFCPGRLRYRFRRMIIYLSFTIIPWGLFYALNKMISTFMINNPYQYQSSILLRANFLIKTLISWFLPWRNYPGLT
ncbi:MAG: hypothetical protein JW784_02215, partial [Candidatus Cloacimonetes bacterium]|nr:hypothetical protein [Candidatus Cloacimonadota bacterium]